MITNDFNILYIFVHYIKDCVIGLDAAIKTTTARVWNCLSNGTHMEFLENNIFAVPFAGRPTWATEITPFTLKG